MSDFQIAEQLRSVDRSLVRQQNLIESIKGIAIGLERDAREQHRGGGVDLVLALIRSLVCKLKACGSLLDSEPTHVAERIYGRRSDFQRVLQALNNLPDLIQRAAVNPAQTTVSGWGSELVGTRVAGLMPALAPSSAYSKLAPRSLRLNFVGNGTIYVPSRLSTPTVAGDFVLEASPIPVRKIGLDPVAIGPPRKLGVISYFSDELKEHSVPSIEGVLRAAIDDDTSVTLDTRMLDATAGSATRPAGLLNGVSPIVAVAGGGLAALSGDLGALAGAIPSATDLVFLMNDADRMRAMTLSPGLLAATIILAPTLPAKKIVALDCGDLVTGENDQARFDVSTQTTLHTEDSSPLPLVSGTTQPPSLAQIGTPLRSMFQENLTAVKMIQWVTWAMRRPNRVAFVENVTW